MYYKTQYIHIQDNAEKQGKQISLEMLQIQNYEMAKVTATACSRESMIMVERQNA